MKVLTSDDILDHCPLPYEVKTDLHQGVTSLIPKCREIGCPFIDSNYDSDYLPGGCVLFVVALLDPDRTKELEPCCIPTVPKER